MNIEEINKIINPKYTEDKNIADLNNQFVNAPHCKHIFLDDFLRKKLPIYYMKIFQVLRV